MVSWPVARGRLPGSRAPSAPPSSFPAARLATDPASAIARANALAAGGAVAAARDALAALLAAEPGNVDALQAAGNVELRAGAPANAVPFYRRALAVDPHRVELRSNLALALDATGARAEAAAQIGEALRLTPERVDLYRVAAGLALIAGRHDEALARCREGLTRAPGHVALALLQARVFQQTGRLTEAAGALAALAVAQPANVDVAIAQGGVSLQLGHFADAARHYRRAVAAGVDHPGVWTGLGIACQMEDEGDEAARAFERAAARAPGAPQPLAYLFANAAAAGDWARATAVERRLLPMIAAVQGAVALPPFVTLFLHVDPPAQRAIATAWSATLPAPAPASAPAIVRQRGSPLRIGYLSGDFHDHATARLMAGLFEAHDRRAVDAFAYSYGPDDGSALRARVRAAFPHWRELRGASDGAAADVIRADDLDVLIELKGHTTGSRLAILASRPARRQIHYLGYPGTIAYPAVDAIVADAIVVPPDDDAAYGERVLRLPRCYQVNDRARALPPAANRAALGLADDAIAIGCFNQASKLGAAFFDAWTEALAAHPAATLVLYAPHPSLAPRLEAAAHEAGLAPGRLRAWPKAPPDAHVARLRCLDLALDTLPCGAHTTGSDALWAGVPLLTCAGSTFAGRVGASLAAAAGLGDFVTTSLSEYRATLDALLRDRARLADAKRRLHAARDSSELFDTAGFARAFEALLAQAADAPGAAA